VDYLVGAIFQWILLVNGGIGNSTRELE
jgi:hypothetical protein